MPYITLSNKSKSWQETKNAEGTFTNFIATWLHEAGISYELWNHLV